MSTIEKAAARLATRAKAGNAAEDRSGFVRTESVDSPVVERRQVSDHVGQPEDRQESKVQSGAELRVQSENTAGGGTQEEAPSTSVRPLARVVSDRRIHLDLESITSRGFLTPGASRSPLAQQMRRLKRPLLLRMQKARANLEEGPPANLIMVTSSLPGEGKTFTSINLAMSMAAEVDHRVLLVDADSARGDISRQFGMPRREGLAGLLTRGSDYVEGEIIDTNVERLSMLPAGEPVEHVDELYASTTMASLLHSVAMADPGRIVIFDCAPLLVATEVAVLAPLMGQIVVVVEANRTPQDAVLRALQMLDGCPNVSLVLNKSTTSDEDSYGYGYGYGAFGGEGGGGSPPGPTDGMTGEGR